MSVRSQEIFGETRGKLYVLKVIHEKEYVNIAIEESNLNLWHCRFGHLGMENISKLIDGDMVDGMKTTKDNVTETCESCVMGKQHRTAYPKEILYRAVEPFEIVHSDVCGPSYACQFIWKLALLRYLYRRLLKVYACLLHQKKEQSARQIQRIR